MKETPVLARRFAAEFRCIGAECPDTCCSGWPVVVDRLSKWKYWLQPELRDTTQRTPDGTVMQMDAKSKLCVMFDRGICGIQKSYGEEYMNTTCHEYPRSYHRFDTQVQMTAILSCPEAARAALEDTAPFDWVGISRARKPNAPQLLPKGWTQEAQHAAVERLLQASQNPNTPPEATMGRLLSLALALDKQAPAAWQGILRQQQDTPPSAGTKGAATLKDLTQLLRGGLGIAIVSESQYRPRLYSTLRYIEQGLRLNAHWTEGRVSSPNISASTEAWRAVQASWEAHRQKMEPALRRWLGAQICLYDFPFTALGESTACYGMLLAAHFALLRLAMMCACHMHNGEVPLEMQVTMIQSLSRVLVHITDTSLLYTHFPFKEWEASPQRIHALIGDIA